MKQAAPHRAAQTDSVNAWDGFIIVDQDGRLVVWRGSAVVRLYRSREQARHSLQPGWSLTPITIRAAAFEGAARFAIPALVGDRAPDLTTRVLGAVEPKLTTALAPLKSKPSRRVVDGTRARVLAYLSTNRGDYSAAEVAAAVNRLPRLVGIELSQLAAMGRATRVSRGRYRAAA